MNKSNAGKLSVLAAAVAVGLGSSLVLAQDDELQTDEVREAADELERAEDRLENAEQAVQEREEEFEEAIAEAAEADEADSSDDDFGDVSDWDDSDWDELLEEHENLGTFVEALRLTGLGDTLTNGTPYTVFAPVDEAFEDDREELLSEDNREELVELLRGHIVADDVDPDRARTLDEALTVDGGRIDLSVDDDELMVGDAKVVGSHVVRENLRIYAIDELLDVDPASSLALGDFDDD